MATELQTALQVTPPSGAFDGHMLAILAIMVVSGILGGIANFFVAERPAEADWKDALKYPVLGVVAALTVPLFLNMMSSTLLEGARTKPVDFFTFAGFCLLYVLASRRLFEGLAHRLLAQVDQVRREMGQLQRRSEERAEMPTEDRVEPRVENRTEVKESLSYNDVEILRALSEESYVYGNLAALCDRTGLARDLVSQRLTVMKNQGVIETRINEKNVLHWSVSSRGKQLLNEILAGQDDPCTA